jgi:hypothetical protein
MIGRLFEAPERGGNVWRLEVVHHNGRTFANWRKWWRDADGELKPSRQGVTFPPERLADLRYAIEAWETDNALSGPENAC